jgi:hypothetical protein
MSISGAVAELNKEIERLTQIRDSLLQGASESATRGSVAAAPATAAKKSASGRKPGPKRPGPKKPVAEKKSVPAKTTAPAVKRVISAATRKKMSDAAKARAAKKASAAK